MLPIPTTSKTSSKHKSLLRVFDGLSESDQKSVLSFAEFLAQRSDAQEPELAESETVESQAKPMPRDIPRPEKESVVAAMRRLSDTYFMLSKDDLLHKASDLMSAHILHSKSAVIVIDELEVLFAESYAQQIGPKID